jgi:hypothetical protein
VTGKSAAEWLLPRYDSVTLVCSLALGIAAAVGVALAADGAVAADLYAVAAQTLPVFLIALAVEQRLLNRLGMSEEAYTREATAMLELGVRGSLAQEEGDPAFIELSQMWESRPRFHWVAPFVDEEVQGIPEDQRTYGSVEVAARQRFTAARRGQARWSAGAIVLLTLGLFGSLSGLAADGTSTGCVYFWLTATTFPATFFLIALTAVREVVEDLALG